MKNRLTKQPPRLQEHHIRMPHQLARILRASSVHSQGVTGRRIRIAVIDSGFYPHPYYVSRGYKIRYVPTSKEPSPHIDHYGHGTAHLSSLFAIAPAAEVLAIKCMDRDPSEAIEEALKLKPHILNCAWGFNIDHSELGGAGVPESYLRIHQLLLKAIAQGITVIASAGNGQNAFPACMPEVIAAGGVYYGSGGNFSSSDASSRFESTIFPGRKVPDVCGVVGNLPHGRLLLLPVPPRSRLTRQNSPFAMIAASDIAALTAMTEVEGWAMFSGTSAATAMVSGAVALMLEGNPALTPLQIRQCLIKSARSVTRPGDHESDPLLDVTAAVSLSSSYR